MDWITQIVNQDQLNYSHYGVEEDAGYKDMVERTQRLQSYENNYRKTLISNHLKDGSLSGYTLTHRVLESRTSPVAHTLDPLNQYKQALSAQYEDMHSL